MSARIWIASGCALLGAATWLAFAEPATARVEAPFAAHTHAPAEARIYPRLEDFMLESYGQGWDEARQELLELGLVTEEKLSAPFDPVGVEPWPVVSAGLEEQLCGSGFGAEKIRQALHGWSQPTLEGNLARFGLGDPALTLSEEQREALWSVVGAYQPALDELAVAAAEEVRGLVRQLWSADGLLRVPTLGVEPETVAMERPEHTLFAYRILLNISGWTVVVAPDTARSVALGEILGRVRGLRGERTLDLQRCLARVDSPGK